MARLLFIVGAVLVMSVCSSDGTVTLPQASQITTVGRTTTVVCQITGETFVAWETPSKPGQPSQSITLSTTGRRTVAQSSNTYTLTISNTDVNDGGDYYCRGSENSKKFTLYVNYVIQNVNYKQTLHLGKTETVDLDVSGYPDLTYTWTKDGQPITFTAGGHKTLNPHTGSITFSPVQQSDQGNYTCVVSSSILGGHLFDPISVMVIDVFQWTKQPNKPTVVVEDVNNTNVRLVWEFLLGPGETLVQVIFQRQKPGAVIRTSLASRLANSAFTIFPAHQQEYGATLPNTLLLRNVTKNEYIYSIVVVYHIKNSITTDIRDQVKVIVYARPRINKYQGDPVRRTLVEGNNITFHCNVTAGSPKPTISWYFGWTTTNKKVDPIYDSRYSFPTEEKLTITGVERRDEGKYRCIAENIAGKDELRFEISAAVVCQDTWPKSTCRYFKKYCNHHAVYPICKKTCNMCSSCADRWPEVFCRLYRQWCHYPSVLVNCRRSCKTCSDTKLD